MKLSKKVRELLNQQQVELPWWEGKVFIKGLKEILFTRRAEKNKTQGTFSGELHYRVEPRTDKGRVKMSILKVPVRAEIIETVPIWQAFRFTPLPEKAELIAKDIGDLWSVRMRERLRKEVKKNDWTMLKLVELDLEKIADRLPYYLKNREGILLESVKGKVDDTIFAEPKSFEALILEAVLSLESRVKNGKLPVKLITDTLNQGRSAKERFSYALIGIRLGKIGFKKSPLSDGASAILFSKKLLEFLMKKYGVERPAANRQNLDSQSSRTDTTDGSKRKSASSVVKEETPTEGPNYGITTSQERPPWWVPYESEGLVRRGEIPRTFKRSNERKKRDRS